MEHLTATQVRRRFGGISDMTLWRWLNDERVGFPQPLVVNQRRYFRLADIEAFEQRKAKAAQMSDAGAA